MDITWLEIWKFHGAALLAGCVIDWIIGDPYGFPSGAPYGNHDSRDGISSENGQRDGKERAVRQRSSRCIHVYPYGGVFHGQSFTGQSIYNIRGLGGSLFLAEGFTCYLMLAARGLYTET